MIRHFTGDMDIWWCLHHPWKTLHDLFRETKAFIHRGLYGWHFSDTWSMNTSLAKVISDMLLCRAFDGRWLFDEDAITPEEKNYRERLILVAHAFDMYVTMMDLTHGFTYEEQEQFLQRAMDTMPTLIELLPTLRDRGDNEIPRV